jgi:hypothetical protein
MNAPNLKPRPKGVYVGDIVNLRGAPKIGTVKEISADLRVLVSGNGREWWVENWRDLEVLTTTPESVFNRGAAK